MTSAFATSPAVLSSVHARAPLRAAVLSRRQQRATAVRPVTRAALDALAPAVLLAEDIYGELARGGFGIIASGVVGAMIVGYIMQGSMDEVWYRCSRSLLVRTQGKCCGALVDV
jgi:ABC-type xylose transport system permease subunit